MAKIQEMLSLNGGSFKKAEEMAYRLIQNGDVNVYLDLALLKCAQGDLVGCRKAQMAYETYFPDCPRLNYSKSWFKLYDGDLQEGLKHIEYGRSINALGDPDIKDVRGKKWDGKASIKDKTVLLYGEGGFGDQIMGLRSAKVLHDMGAKVIVASSPELVKLFSHAKYVNASISIKNAVNTHYDYWIPEMSGYRLCNFTWETLWTGNFFNELTENKLWKRIITKNGKPNIGIRWSGNPKFEHEQLRVFPPELLFNVVNSDKYNVYSLQKDDDQTILPENVTDLSPFLSSWEQTAMAIQEMDLVISSCTSVAHLSASIGKETYVVVPAMPYYPWAKPGNKSQWYPSVTLFRQKCYGKWDDAFSELKNTLQQKYN